MSVDLREVYGLMGRGDWDEAQMRCRALLNDGNDAAPVHHALGLSLCGSGAFEQAIAPLARAVELEGSTTAWARDAGALYAKLERWCETMTVLEPVVSGLDADGLALFLISAVESDRATDGIEALTEDAIRTLQQDPDALCAYGRALHHAKRHAEAEAVLTDCLERFNEVPGVRDALARTCEATQRGDRALEHARAAAEAEPDSARIVLRLAIAYGDRGLWEECRIARKQGTSLGLTHPEEHASLLYMMLSDPAETAESLLAAARKAFEPRKHAGTTTTTRRTTKTRRHEEKRLRIGYLSGGFLNTPSYFFSYPFLANHDRASVDVFLYNHRTPQDFSNASVSKASLGEHYMEVGHLSDSDLGAQLRSDRLDVLVHMAGHFSYDGLRLLCERLAPVQISYPHFPASTGCPGIDYMFTDRWLSPLGSDAEYSEQLYRIPGGSLVWASPEDGPACVPPPRTTRRYPTFGIFQRLAKFNTPFWEAVTTVLDRIPGSRLLIHNGDAELNRPDSATVRTLRQRLDARGIDQARLVLRGPLPYLEHLRMTGQVDVALDSFPYNGQTTTCEAMWMGVPVVTMSCGTHVSRVGASLLARAGYSEWVAKASEEYVQIASSLASDVERLVMLRGRLRDDFVSAGLTDGRILARSLEDAYAKMLSQEPMADAQHP